MYKWFRYLLHTLCFHCVFDSIKSVQGILWQHMFSLFSSNFQSLFLFRYNLNRYSLNLSWREVCKTCWRRNHYFTYYWFYTDTWELYFTHIYLLDVGFDHLNELLFSFRLTACKDCHIVRSQEHIHKHILVKLSLI